MKQCNITIAHTLFHPAVHARQLATVVRHGKRKLEWAESLIAIAWVTQCQHTQYMHNADWHWCEVCLIKQPFTKLHKDQMVETRYVGTVQKYCSVIPIYHFASKHVTIWTCIKTKAKKNWPSAGINHRVLATSVLNTELYTTTWQPPAHPPSQTISSYIYTACTVGTKSVNHLPVGCHITIEDSEGISAWIDSRWLLTYCFPLQFVNCVSITHLFLAEVRCLTLEIEIYMSC